MKNIKDLNIFFFKKLVIAQEKFILLRVSSKLNTATYLKW